MSITGLTGHIALAKQTAWGTPNTTAGQYKSVKITGDSVVAANNQLTAENEIGAGRDVTQSIPGGFSVAGAVNGNLRPRAAAAFLEGVLGTLAAVAPDAGATPPTSGHDLFTPADVLPFYTVEKKVGTDARTPNELLTLRYTDTVVNTLNISAPSGGLATFSAGLIAAGEQYLAAPIVTPSYAATSDELLAFHGGRIRLKDSTDNMSVSFAAGDNDTTFQSIEVVINNNVAADEFTVRPSRFLRSVTEGQRAIELNLTIVFENYNTYRKYTYGAAANTAPGYNLYMGAIQLFLGNWQIADTDEFNRASGSTIPATNAQAVQFKIPKIAFAGLPVTLASGRIAVSTTARALKPTTGAILEAYVRPSAA